MRVALKSDDTLHVDVADLFVKSVCLKNAGRSFRARMRCFIGDSGLVPVDGFDQTLASERAMEKCVAQWAFFLASWLDRPLAKMAWSAEATPRNSVLKSEVSRSEGIREVLRYVTGAAVTMENDFGDNAVVNMQTDGAQIGCKSRQLTCGVTSQDEAVWAPFQMF